MRFVFVVSVDFPKGGGAARCVHMLAKGLVNTGHQVTIVLASSGQPGVRDAVIDGIQVRWAHAPQSMAERSALGRARDWLTARWCRTAMIVEIVRQHACDWMVFYSVGMDSVPSFLLARLWGQKVAGLFGDNRFLQANATVMRRLQGLTHATADIIVSRLSSVVLIGGSFALERLFTAVARKAKVVKVIPPVDVRLFSDGDASRFRKRYGIDIHDRLVVYSGAMAIWEGVDVLLQAMCQVFSSSNAVRLVLAGYVSDSTGASVIGAVRSMGIGDRTTVLQRLSLEDVVDMTAAASVLVIPKTDHPVNDAAMPIKLGEYLASGNPVVVSDRPSDMHHYVKHGWTGLLFESGSPGALAQAILELLENPERARAIGRRGQALALDTFDIIPVADRLATALGAPSACQHRPQIPHKQRRGTL
jgi:glycosyltransferase involved in cell wall biosynthesis